MRTYKTKKALSLVEVLLAIFIMGLAFMSFGPAFVFSRLAVEKSRYTEIASEAAHAELEKWREVPYEELPQIPSGKTAIFVPLTSNNTLPKSSAGIKFTKVDERLRPTTQNAKRTIAEVTITWNAGRKNHGAVVMNTLLTEGAL